MSDSNQTAPAIPAVAPAPFVRHPLPAAEPTPAEPPVSVIVETKAPAVQEPAPGAPKPTPAVMQYRNGRKAGHREPIIYRDRNGVVRVGHTGQLAKGAISPNVAISVLSTGGTGCDTVPINQLWHAEDALAALEGPVVADAQKLPPEPPAGA
jgi:hypothetical protein